jgi:hypothetical protein
VRACVHAFAVDADFFFALTDRFQLAAQSERRERRTDFGWRFTEEGGAKANVVGSE